MPNGLYKLRVRAGVVDSAPSYRHFLEVGHPENLAETWTTDVFPSKHASTGSPSEPQVIETILKVNSDTTREFAIRERQPTLGTTTKALFTPNKIKIRMVMNQLFGWIG